MITQALVDYPDEVRVAFRSGTVDPVLAVRVAPQDIGKALGRQGRLANAARIIVKCAAMKSKRKVYLEFDANLDE